LDQKKIEDAKAELVRQEAELDKLKISVKQVNLIKLNSLRINNEYCIVFRLK